MVADHPRLSVEELEALEGAPLPERTAMSALMLPTPVGADPRVLVGGAEIVGGASPDAANQHIPETDV
jgi:hypothetical protein